MNFKLKLIIGGFVVLVASSLTMVAGYPKVLSPYSFSVVLPAFFFYSNNTHDPIFLRTLSSLPILILYFVSSTVFIKATYNITKATIGFAIVLIILSITYNIYSFQYGVEYQGVLHTLLMYGYNLTLLSVMIFLYKKNKSRPTSNNLIGFNVVLYSWFGWVSFPWLGELI